MADEVKVDTKSNKAADQAFDLFQSLFFGGLLFLIGFDSQAREEARNVGRRIGAVTRTISVFANRILRYNVASMVKAIAFASAFCMIVSTAVSFLFLQLAPVRVPEGMGERLRFELMSSGWTLAQLLLLLAGPVVVIIAYWGLKWVPLTYRSPQIADAPDADTLTEQEIRRRAQVGAQDFIERFGRSRISPFLAMFFVFVPFALSSCLLIAEAVTVFTAWRVSWFTMFPFTMGIIVCAIGMLILLALCVILVIKFTNGFIIGIADQGVKVSTEALKAGLAAVLPGIDYANVDRRLGEYKEGIEKFGDAVESGFQKFLSGPAAWLSLVIFYPHAFVAMVVSLAAIVGSLTLYVEDKADLPTKERVQRSARLVSFIGIAGVIFVAFIYLDYAIFECYISATLNAIIDVTNAFLTFNLASLSRQSWLETFFGAAVIIGFVVAAWRWRSLPLKKDAHPIVRVGTTFLLVFMIAFVSGIVLNITGKGAHIPSLPMACANPSAIVILAERPPASLPALDADHSYAATRGVPGVQAPPPVARVPAPIRRVMVATATAPASRWTDPCLDASNPGYQAMMRRLNRCDPSSGRYIGPR